MTINKSIVDDMFFMLLNVSMLIRLALDVE